MWLRCLRLGFGFWRAAVRGRAAVGEQPPQAPFRCGRCGDHATATALRGLVAPAVGDRHLILSRLVDVTDAARVGIGVYERRMLGRIKGAALGIKAASPIDLGRAVVV
jgi:hypothetical protein